MIGITIKKREKEKSSYESGEAIVYNGKGFVYSGLDKKEKQGSGFREGDIIRVKTNLKKNSI